MASQFREISLTPESFRVQSEDTTNQIDFIFARSDLESESQPQSSRSDSVDGASADSISAVYDYDDEDDGFRTPTSSDYKIPVLEHCPPAPRRSKPTISLSRTSPRVSGVRRCFRVFISDEIVESIFSSSFGSDFLQQRNKKARQDDNHGGETQS